MLTIIVKSMIEDLTALINNRHSHKQHFSSVQPQQERQFTGRSHFTEEGRMGWVSRSSTACDESVALQINN